MKIKAKDINATYLNQTVSFTKDMATYEGKIVSIEIQQQSELYENRIRVTLKIVKDIYRAWQWFDGEDYLDITPNEKESNDDSK